MLTTNYKGSFINFTAVTSDNVSNVVACNMLTKDVMFYIHWCRTVTTNDELMNVCHAIDDVVRQMFHQVGQLSQSVSQGLVAFVANESPEGSDDGYDLTTIHGFLKFGNRHAAIFPYTFFVAAKQEIE